MPSPRGTPEAESYADFQRYVKELKRRGIFVDYDEFLRSLEMKAEIAPFSSVSYETLMRSATWLSSLRKNSMFKRVKLLTAFWAFDKIRSVVF